MQYEVISARVYTSTGFEDFTVGKELSNRTDKHILDIVTTHSVLVTKVCINENTIIIDLKIGQSTRRLEYVGLKYRLFYK